MDQQFSLRWDDYRDQLSDAFGSFRYEEDLVDVTLSCEGRKIKAHKILLSACSPYFHDIFKDNPCQHPVIVFRNVKHEDLKSIIDFIYKGEVSVLHDQLESFLSTAEMLDVKGLTVKENHDCVQTTETDLESVKENGQKKQPVSRKQNVSTSLLSSQAHSPPAKRRKSTQKEQEYELIMSDVVVKEEVEDPLYVEEEADPLNVEAIEVNVTDVIEPEPPSLSVPKVKKKRCPAKASQNIVTGRGQVEAFDTPLEHIPVRLPGNKTRSCALCRGSSRYWCPGCNVGVHPSCSYNLKHISEPNLKSGKQKNK